MLLSLSCLISVPSFFLLQNVSNELFTISYLNLICTMRNKKQQTGRK
jgi:hypothetical protein